MPPYPVLSVLQIVEIYEPTVLSTILAPADYCGAIMQLCTARRGLQLEYSYMNTPTATAAATNNDSTIGNAPNGSVPSSSSGAGEGTGGSDCLDPMAVAQVEAINSSSSSSSRGSGSGLFGDRVVLRYQLPLAELAGDFYSKLKSVTHG